GGGCDDRVGTPTLAPFVREFPGSAGRSVRGNRALRASEPSSDCGPDSQDEHDFPLVLVPPNGVDCPFGAAYDIRKLLHPLVDGGILVVVVFPIAHNPRLSNIEFERKAVIHGALREVTHNRSLFSLSELHITRVHRI